MVHQSPYLLIPKPIPMFVHLALGHSSNQSYLAQSRYLYKLPYLQIQDRFAIPVEVVV